MTKFWLRKNRILMRYIFGLVVGCLSCKNFAATLSETIHIDFYSAMSHSKNYNQTFAERDPSWQTLRMLYEKGIRREFSRTTLRIPKIAHLIWLGSKPPARYKKLRNSFAALHPDWKILLWTDKEAAQYTMINRHAFTNAVNFAEKSDIFRYEILYALGGVYIDGDFEIRKSLDDLHYACSLYTGIAYDRKAQLYNGLIGAEPKHPIIKECIQKLGTGGRKSDPEAIMHRTGPYHFTRCFFSQQAHRDAVIAFPVAFFYPVPNYDRYDILEKKVKQYWQSYSYGIHYWACSWVPQHEKH